MIGATARRKEDRRLVTGRGQYVDDIKLNDLLYVTFVRSPYAHARIKQIDAEAALAIPGIIAVLTRDNCPFMTQEMPSVQEAGTLNNPYCDLSWVAPHALFPDIVRYVGEQFAAIISEDPYIGADALELIDVDYEMLPVVACWETAQDDSGPRVHSEHSNRIAHLSHAYGDFDAAASQAEIVFSERLEMQSVKSMATECRGSTAQWDPLLSRLNVWTTSQQYYLVRDSIAGISGLPTDRIRMIARDIGGGFGLKGVPSPEDIIVPLMAYHLKRNLRWTETRSEHMIASHHSGVQVHDVTVAANKNGELLGIDIRIFKEVGAYNHFEMVTTTNTVNHLTTHYKLPNLKADAVSIATNKTPVTPYRGAGRIEAVFTMDRILDGIARETGLDPLEVRRRNIISLFEMPYSGGLIYRDGVPVTYDNMDFPTMLETACEKAGYADWRERQAALRSEGRHIGLGISSYVEAGGVGPCEGARVTINSGGTVSVYAGVNSQGQSHETTFAQICAEHIGAEFDSVSVFGGDTAAFRIGFGTAASRVLVNTGNAIYEACNALKVKVSTLASVILGCDPEDIELCANQARVRGAANRAISFARLSRVAERHPIMKDLGGPELTAEAFFYPRTVTWSSGVHVAVVELNPQTGDVKILKYVIVHDCGVPINPAVVEGQIQGGFAQGLGIALMEDLLYDDEAQVISGSLMDYAVPKAHHMPELELHHFEFPTVENPLGVRAVGESGPLSVPAALASAIDDASAGALRMTQLPITPSRIRGDFERFEASGIPPMEGA